MDKFDKFVIGGIFFVLTTVVSAIIISEHQNNSTIVELVKLGASPLEARCAIKN